MSDQPSGAGPPDDDDAPSMNAELTAAVVIAEGGWDSRYARVLLIQRLGDEAIVLLDGNGDGAEIESERWFQSKVQRPANSSMT